MPLSILGAGVAQAQDQAPRPTDMASLVECGALVVDRAEDSDEGSMDTDIIQSLPSGMDLFHQAQYHPDSGQNASASTSPKTVIGPDQRLDGRHGDWLSLALASDLEIREIEADDATDAAAAAKAYNNAEQTSGWFKLPAEIRNKIYNLLCDAETYELKWLNNKRKSRGLTHWKYKYSRSSFDKHKIPGRYVYGSVEWKRQFSRPADPKKILEARERRRIKRRVVGPLDPEEAAAGPAGWLGTCRQMHEEGAPIFYARNTFSFADAHILHEFAKQLTPLARLYVWSLYLSHDTYGDPYHTKFVHYKEQYDLTFALYMEEIANWLPVLKHLSIFIRLNDTPLDLTEHAAWAQPLFHLKDKSLEVFDLWLTSECNTTFNNQQLRDSIEWYRAEVLGDAFFKVPAKNAKPKVKAGVLRIVW